MINNMSIEQKKYISKVNRDKKIITTSQFLILLILIITWEICAIYGIIDSFIFSSPTRIINTFIEMIEDGSIFYHIWVTFYETIISFILGTFLGIIIAVILWWNDKIAKILEPYLIVFNSLPKTALAPVIMVWLGFNHKSIIVTALTVTIVIAIMNVYNGFINVDTEKIKLIYTFNGTKMKVLTKVVIPANFSNIISTMKINIGLSLIGVVIGEFFSPRAGLGYLILYGSQVLKMDWVIMSVIILALLATGLYEIIVLIEKRVNKINA